ncbi:hypothetical protein Y1Q_0022415 [Alligator mississippiensis]|uniref:Uncharacterized protein n=1 Tax=Alligator mississippiensis TaxID=8496 RepID=A0A151N0B4_ALLMI|nr:hypothetical protein Y1Q_0022415 [Alligator mississippiensis]
MRSQFTWVKDWRTEPLGLKSFFGTGRSIMDPYNFSRMKIHRLCRSSSACSTKEDGKEVGLFLLLTDQPS